MDIDEGSFDRLITQSNEIIDKLLDSETNSGKTSPLIYTILTNVSDYIEDDQTSKYRSMEQALREQLVFLSSSTGLSGTYKMFQNVFLLKV